MESTTCDVRHIRLAQKNPDGLAVLQDVPTSIKDQMPELAAMLQELARQLGRETVQKQLQASMDLRRAFDAGNYQAVNAVYRSGHGWIDWQENGFCIGVPKAAMQAFAAKHRNRAA